MKPSFALRHYITSLGLTLGIMIFLSSCEVYHFEKPQPADAASQYVFPKEFQGRWQDDDAETIVIMKEKSIWMSGYDSIKVINKIATRADTVFGHYLKSIHYNKETKQLDTLTHYVIKGAKIYEVGKRGLEYGFPFAQRKDTLYFKKETILDFELNQKAFLRKLTDKRYILNIYEENLWPLLEGGVGPWWQIILLEMTADGKINFKDIDDSVKPNASLIYSSGSDFYFDVSWSKSELINLSNHGLFGTGKDNLHRVGKSTAIKKK